MSHAKSLKKVKINHTGPIHRNMHAAILIENSIRRGEGMLTKCGALAVTTGKYTGRSPNDRYFVDKGQSHEKINWNKANIPISESEFNALHDHLADYLSRQPELYIFDGMVGADPKHTVHVRVVNDLPHQNLFAQSLLRRPTKEELKSHEPAYTLLVSPNCKADPKSQSTNSEAFIVLNIEDNLILIGGSGYAGEIKKSLFTLLNYLYPNKGILPMHCGANVGKEHEDVALFFGLSGTGKTSLSTDPKRLLLGDDEHGWSENGIFNFEGGCYAKCINLDPIKESQIFEAIKHGALVENVVVDPETRTIDYADSKHTQNTRAGYPMHHVPDAILSGMAGHPNNIFFLTADAFGIIPPISKLSQEEAMYHYLSGYTAKLAGTERGVTEPQATFSAFFGEPFMPQKPMVYANLLKNYISKHKTNVWLVNTGWTGGEYGVGHRIDINYTRAMINAALEGKLEKAKTQRHEILNLNMILECPDVPDTVLNPRGTWSDKAAYDKKAKELAKLFKSNMKRWNEIPEKILQAGPKA